MRFKLIKGSESGHDCCFEWSIVDTDEPLDRYKLATGGFTKQKYEIVCECFNLKSAELISHCLNMIRS